MIDYKLVIEREVDGLVYQKVRFYEGAVTTEDETSYNSETDQFITEPVTRYRRTAMIEEREYYYEQAPS
jgi:hypothetical protein